MFDTYGPFTMPTHDQSGIEHLFDEQIKNDPTSDIDLGFGVYIVAAKTPEGELIPWYVGRTQKHFGKRIMQHYEHGKFRALAEQGPLYFFLLARARDGRIQKSSEQQATRENRAVEYLELILIGTCLKRNAKLLNLQQKRFHERLHVAGYLDNGPAGREPAAQALSKLLKT